MEIKKFEAYSYHFDHKYGGHSFVLARYKGGWDNCTIRTPFENDEYIPCMISNVLLHQWSKYELNLIGETGSWDIDKFEILEGSDKGFKEMIEMYTSSKKYNL